MGKALDKEVYGMRARVWRFNQPYDEEDYVRNRGRFRYFGQ